MQKTSRTDAAAAAAAAVGLTLESPPTRWTIRVRPVTPEDARGVVMYAPALDCVLCAPCIRDAGPRWAEEFGGKRNVRPATSIEMQRLGCCSSCGRDFSEAVG